MFCSGEDQCYVGKVRGGSAGGHAIGAPPLARRALQEVSLGVPGPLGLRVLGAGEWLAEEGEKAAVHEVVAGGGAGGLCGEISPAALELFQLPMPPGKGLAGLAGTRSPQPPRTCSSALSTPQPPIPYTLEL